MLPIENIVYDRLNGLKPQAQVPPLSLSMVSTPLGPDEVPVLPDDDGELLAQAAASTPAAMRTPIVLRRLIASPPRSVLCAGSRPVPGRPDAQERWMVGR